MALSTSTSTRSKIRNTFLSGASFKWASQILKDVFAYKLRSFLAIFGIFWGTLSVILLLALGAGFQKASQKNIMRLADGCFGA